MSYHATHKKPVLQQSIRRVMRRTGATLGLLGLPGLALAGPEGEDVIRGAADVVRPDANTTTINQLTDRAIINWQTFNVDADEFVIFDQLDSSSVVLNRVLSSDASYIFGNISANGHVFLVNPHGVFFGEGAVLDVQGFLGSTLDIADDDFMQGNYSFTRADNAAALGQVVNEGQITAGEGGYVVLAGDFTQNTGLISAQGGTAALVSGNALTLDLQGDGLVNFAVNEATLAGEAGVHNAGSLLADGGMVVMTARVANEVTSTVVNNEGTVRARAIENRGGDIWLVGHGGNVENSGTLDASGENGDGGQMMVWSDNDVTLHDGGVQTVDGAEGHDAGDARFIAREHLDYQANNLISADGETGGTVEVSGHGGLNVAGNPVIGPNGELVIDPDHIAITANSNAPALTSAGSTYNWVGAGTPLFYDSATEDVTALGADWIASELGLGVNVVLVASETITFDGTPPATLSQTGTAVGDLSLYIGSVASAGGASTFGLGLAGGVFGSGGTPVVNVSADPDSGLIDLSGLTLDIPNVNFTASILGGGTADSINLPDITASTITVNAGSGDITFAGSFGSASLNAGGNIDITGGTVQGGYFHNANNVTVNADVIGTNFYVGSSGTTGNVSDLTVNGNINVSNSAFAYVQGNSANINLNGIVSAGAAITLFTSAGSSSPGNITVGNTMSAPTITITANGGGGPATGGNVTLSAVSGDSINITANQGGAGGGIIDTGVINGNGQVTLSATSIGGNSLVIGNALQPNNVTINAPINVTNNVDIRILGTAVENGVIGFNGNVTAGGSIIASIGGTAGANLISGSTANLSATNINLDAGSIGDGNIDFANLDATNNIQLTANQIEVDWYRTANSIAISASSMIGPNLLVGSGGGTSGAVNNFVANSRVNVGGSIDLRVATGGLIDLAGSFVNSGAVNITAGSTGTVDLNGGVVLGGNTVTLTGGTVNPNNRITTSGSITINGNVGGGSFSLGSSLARAGNVTITGGVNVTGNATIYTQGFGNEINIGSAISAQGVLLDAITTGGSAGNVIVGGGITTTTGGV
ncbi:MAG: filamentous hemagglutinin N-terminal domain-containing protein, partial [Gammaproteobacteria bacterium]|nr:filamentous hemagglutinin N-terminal domain-containing protein [Gammaproteobacteria bacterium]